MPDLWNVGSASVQLIKLIRSIYMQPESQHYLSLSLSLSLSSSFSLYFSSHSHQLKWTNPTRRWIAVIVATKSTDIKKTFGPHQQISHQHIQSELTKD